MSQILILSRRLRIVILLLACVGSPGDSASTYPECALVLSAKYRLDGRTLCLRYEDIDDAFDRARQRVGLRFPPRDINDQTLSLLGTALQETTEILKKRFSLSTWEVEEGLGSVDTSKTEISRYCAGEPLVVREPCRQERYRRHDATCNNLRHPSWGAANLPFKRLIHPDYADGISEPRTSRSGFPLPNPREVSFRIHGDTSRRHEHAVSFMFPAWGQLVDHDLTLTAETKDPVTRKDIDCCTGGRSRHPNCLPIRLPNNDQFYQLHGQSCMNMARSLAGVRAGCRLGSRVQINSLTSYIDANFMYGSNYKTADSLRLLRDGLMRTSNLFDHLGLKPLLPPKLKQPDDGCIRPNPEIYCFLAGDNRVNEQLALGVLHTLMVREHNRIAIELSELNPHWDDETVYQETRHIMAALVQHITYNEFLPHLLGDKYMADYNLKLKKEGYSTDYDPEMDATIPASFSTAAFRFGHSLIPRVLERRSTTHALIGERRLSEILQQPYDLYEPGAVDEYILGIINQVSQAMDHSITTEVTNHLFQEPSRDFGRDLASINIARAREHGVPGYMEYRKLCGLDDMHSWSDMFSHMPNHTVNHYLDMYSNAEDVDLWSAGVSESPNFGSMVGAVFSCIIALTFRAVKLGDRFWYENGGFPNSFSPDQLNEIRKYTLSRLICNTGDNIRTIQIRSMLLPDYEKNPRVSCKSSELPDLNLKYWKETAKETPYEETYLEVEIDHISEESVINEEKVVRFDQVIAQLTKEKNNNTFQYSNQNGLHNNIDAEKAVKLE